MASRIRQQNRRNVASVQPRGVALNGGAAKAIIEPMLREEPRTLSVLDQSTVATWATKLTLTMQVANIGRQRVVDNSFYPWFERQRQPKHY